MGLTYINGRVRGANLLEEDVRFLVDSGAVYSLLPADVWRRLAIAPLRTEAFSLADGTLIERDVGECWIELPQGRGTTPVLLGVPGDDALLGAVTLEVLGLVLNPFSRTLQPMRMLLKSASEPGDGVTMSS